jgi:hypothetical protein
VLITYTTTIKEKYSGELISTDCSDKYIGSGWLFKLGQLLKEKEIQLVPAEVALKKIQSQQTDPKKVFLIQDGKNKYGQKLLQLGAYKFLIVNLESPLYDPYFYNSLSKYIADFEWIYSYDGFLNKVPENESKLKPFFPSFSFTENLSLSEKPKLNKVCLIASNKYISTKFEYSLLRNLKQIKYYSRALCNPEFREAIKSCLHHSRIQIIEALANQQLIDLYGYGWDNLSNLPKSARLSLEKIIPNIYQGPVANKYSTLSKYKFSLCMENSSLNGYITEKIIDSLVSGSIPIYYGAPNINKIIPADIMICDNAFITPSKLIEKILNISEIESEKIKNNGANFINSLAGKSYASESMAQNIFLKIIDKKIND